MAPDDIEPGTPFDQVIIEQINQCDVILLLFCARSDQSKHVKREIMLAEQQNKLIYPIRIEELQPQGLAYWLQDYQWIDWMDQREEAVERMVKTIRKQLGVSEPEPKLEPDTKPASQQDKTARMAGPPIAETEGLGANHLAKATGVPNEAEKPAARGMDTKGKLLLGTIGFVFLLTILAFALPDEPEEAAYIAEVEDGSILPQPGKYSLKFALTEFETTMPGITRPMVDELAKEAARTTCLSSNDAGTIARQFAADPPQSCPVEELEILDGVLSGNVQCKDNGSIIEAEVNGDLQEDGAAINYKAIEYLELFGPAQKIEYLLKSTATRVGDC